MAEEYITILPARPEPGPIPPHHAQWFDVLQQACRDGNLALMSCLDKATGEPRSVICAVGFDGLEYQFTPLGHLATTDNPFDAYIPPE